MGPSLSLRFKRKPTLKPPVVKAGVEVEKKIANSPAQAEKIHERAAPTPPPPPAEEKSAPKKKTTKKKTTKKKTRQKARPKKTTK